MLIDLPFITRLDYFGSQFFFYIALYCISHLVKYVRTGHEIVLEKSNISTSSARLYLCLKCRAIRHFNIYFVGLLIDEISARSLNSLIFEHLELRYVVK